MTAEDAAARRPVLVIGGPTASGKSSLAMGLAAALNGVVINGDSMQVYKGLPILTAQPSEADVRRLPHKLYSVLDPQDICSAARWRDMALAEIAATHAENKLPVIAGGTGFYMTTLLNGISPVPEVPPGVRAEAIALQKKLGNPGFYEALTVCDPKMAAKLHPSNTQRLVRAWEVMQGTGKSLAEWQELPPAPPPADLRFITITLLPPRDALYPRCNVRFDLMLEAGGLAEAQEFMKAYPNGSSLDKALGYPELSAHLRGEMSLDLAAKQAQQATRNYAKRQMTWFRNQIKAELVIEHSDPTPVLDWLKTQSVSA